MLTESQIVSLLMQDHSYFDSPECCSLYSQEELEHIVIQLKIVEQKYFKRIMELWNDADEKSEKITGRRVVDNAQKQITAYLTRKNVKEIPVVKSSNCNWVTGLLLFMSYILVVGVILFKSM